MIRRPGHSIGRHRVTSTLVALALVVGVLSSCAERMGREGIGVLNSTDVPLTFEYVLQGETHEILGITGVGARSLIIADSSVWAGLWGENGCTTGTLIARGLDGAEVARHGPGLCDTEAWEITRASPASSS